MHVNEKGMYAIQDWIKNNSDKNHDVFYLWSDGIAAEIDRNDLDQELKANGYIDHELKGMRDGQGKVLSIKLYQEHFSK
tara:strand:- start:99 stop:335 length:237 start_codon:yes stop_codon:yes gene_type:complete